MEPTEQRRLLLVGMEGRPRQIFEREVARRPEIGLPRNDDTITLRLQVSGQRSDIVEDAAVVGVGAVVHRIITRQQRGARSEEHTSELQSLMRISYAVFCLNKTQCAHYHQQRD